MTEESRYILAKKIARGGMAEIFLGKHIGEDGFQRLVAIKRILPHYSQEQEFCQMFRDEAHIGKRLQHANIVRVEGFEEVDGSYAMIMEFVDGADVRTLLHAIEQARKRLPLPMACFIIAEAARGLHYAHTKIDEVTQQPLGIVHRDISPQNILVSYEGEIKVTDFGIADAESKLTDTRPGIVKGKYSYMSPEQISAKSVDQRTDVFALSIVLWEMLAMRRLFQGENEVDTIQRVKNCRIDQELRQLNPEVDEELDAILKKGLARDLKKRYRTAADFEKDIRRYMSRKFPEFTPEDLGEFLKKIMENRRSETAADIKKTLTDTNLRPGRKSSSSNHPGDQNTPTSMSRDIELDGRSVPQLTLKSNSPSQLRSTARPAQGMGQSSPIHGPRIRPTSHSQAHGRVMPVRKGSRARRRFSLLKLLLAVSASAALMFVAAKTYTTMMAQYRLGTLLLRTQPKFVRVKIDDRPIDGNRYIDTSAGRFYEIQLAPGSHKILITRNGFLPETYRFNLKGGERLIKDDIVLKPEGALAALKIYQKAAKSSTLLSVNDGYFRATLKSRQKDPIVAKDLLAGTSYELKISPSGDKEFICNFTPRSTSWLAPDELTVDLKDRKCSFKR